MSKIEFLNIPLFAELDRVLKVRLLSQFTQHSFRKGELLFEEGEFGDSLYIIMQGKVRIFLQSEGDRTLAILGERESLGEMSLLTGDPRSAAACAETDVVVLRLLKDEFDSLLREHNSLAIQFAEILARRLAMVNKTSSQVQAEVAAELQISGITGDASSASVTNKSESSSMTSKKFAVAAAPSPYWNTKRGWGILLALLVGGFLFFILRQATTLPRDLVLFLCVFATGIAGVLTGGWPSIVAAILMFVGISASGAESTRQLLAGFSNMYWLTGISYAVCAQILYQSGMLQRFLLTLLVHIKPKKWSQPILAGAIGVLSPLFMPSMRHRADALRVALPSSKVDGLLLTSSSLFIQGSLVGWFTLTILNMSWTSQLMTSWLLAASLVSATFAILLLITHVRRRSKTPVEVSEESMILEEQMQVIGTWSRKDTWSLLTMLLTVPAMCMPWPGEAPFLWIALAALGCITVLQWNDRSFVSEQQVMGWMVFGLLAGLTQHYDQQFVSLEALTAVWDILGEITPLLALLILFVVVALVRLRAGGLIAVWTGLILTLPAWTHYELSLVLPAIVAIMGANIGNPVQSDYVHSVREWINRFVLAGLAITMTFPLWQVTGLTAAQPLNIQPQTQEEQLILNVVLPNNLERAASVRRGVEFAISELAAGSSDQREVVLRYGQAGQQDEQAVMGVAVEDSPALSSTIPWIVFNREAPYVQGPAPSLHRLSLEDSDPFDSEALVKDLDSREIRSIVIYYAPSPEGKTFASSLEKAAKARGMITADRMMLIHSEEGQRQQLKKWRTLGASAIIVYDPDHKIPSMLKTAVQGQPYKPLIIEVPLSDGLARSEQVRDWALAFESRYGMRPDRDSAAGYDAVMLAAAAAREAGGLSPDALSESLSHIRRWSGMLRDYDFNQEAQDE